MAQTISPNSAAEQAADDLTQIRGIGPAVETRLNALGIYQYSQLAVMRPKKIAATLSDMLGFTEQRIIKDDWVGQARRLAAEASQLQPAGETIAANDVGNSHHRQHNIGFSVELLLDATNQVRRTRVIHHHTQKEDSWAGWDPRRLNNFFVESAQLRIPKPPGIQPETVAVSAYVPESFLEPGRLEKAEPAQPGQKLRGFPEIGEVQLFSAVGEQLGAMVAQSQPFTFQLSLDLSQVEIPPGEDLHYAVELFARSYGSRQRSQIGNDEGVLQKNLNAVITLTDQALPEGDYNLEALVAIWPSSQARSLRDQLVVMTEEIRVYSY